MSEHKEYEVGKIYYNKKTHQVFEIVWIDDDTRQVLPCLAKSRTNIKYWKHRTYPTSHIEEYIPPKKLDTYVRIVEAYDGSLTVGLSGPDKNKLKYSGTAPLVGIVRIQWEEGQPEPE